MNSTELVNLILSEIKKVTGPYSKANPIALHEPDFNKTKASKYVEDCLKNGWVSSAGSWVKKFEDLICKYTKAKYAIAITNGTDALRLALHVMGVKSGDEVLIPSFSFIATANAISHLGAIPHFIDIENKSMGMSPKALQKELDLIGIKKDNCIFNRKTGRRISAILPVHIFGHPAEIIKIQSISKEWNLPIVEDAAEALGSWIIDKKKKIHCGLIGDMGIISFNGNKIITTGGGGVIITDNKDKALKARHLSTTAKIEHPWEYDHDQIGWNDRLPNINAALGVAQLERIETLISNKRKLANLYREKFKDFQDIEIIEEPINTLSNYWLVTLRFNWSNKKSVELIRNNLLQESHKAGLMLRPTWKPLHKLKPYLKCPKGNLNNAEEQHLRLINLPSSPQIIDN